MRRFGFTAVIATVLMLMAYPELIAWARKRLLGPTFLLRDKRGLKYRIESGEPFARLAGRPPWLRNMSDDPAMLDYLERVLRPGDVVVDIGASIGAISLVAAKQGCRVLAVEAEGVNFSQLRTNAELNNLPIIAEHVAITDHAGTVALQVFPRSRRGHHTLAGAADATATETVECLTIDELLARHAVDHVDVLKIDIEGAEPEAWAGAHRTFAEGRVDRIIFEVSREPLERMGHRVEDVIDPLRRAGFSIRTFDGKEVSGTPSQQLVNLVAVAAHVR
jgi:FkbM family methyltransferase